MSVVQIEVTTKCNLDCFYCAGRLMPQADMSLEVLSAVLDKVGEPTTVQLQGEGEPLLHPDFWHMVAMTKQRGHRVGTLTNGTVPIDISQLDWLEVSMDTLDEEQNKKSGRNHFDKTMANLLTWIEADRSKLTIKAVGYGQDQSSLRAFCNKHGIQLITQGLSPKAEYASLYPVTPRQTSGRWASCSLAQSKFMFFNVRGERLPCCFLKFPKHSYDQIMTAFDQGRATSDCTGCRLLSTNNLVKLIATDRS